MPVAGRAPGGTIPTMTGTVADISAQIESLFRLSKSAGWDQVGLQFGDLDAPVTRVAVCHEVTPTVAAELVASTIDLVVAYHPLLFRPTTRLIAGSGASGRAFQLIANGTALVVVHTAFDMAPGGTADSLADAVGVVDCTGFGPAWGSDTSKIVTFAPESAVELIVSAMAAAGAGDIGGYSSCSYRSLGTGSFFADATTTPTTGSADTLNREQETRVEMIAPASRTAAVVAALVEAHPYEEPAYDLIETRSNAGMIGRVGRLAEPSTTAALASLVHDRLGGVVRTAGDGPIRTVAVIPGSGGSLLGSANADAVVTGDVSHHQARAALERGISIIDPGHAATERPGVKALYAAVAETIAGTIDMTDIDHDPWKER